jgi:hypothetical protein
MPSQMRRRHGDIQPALRWKTAAAAGSMRACAGGMPQRSDAGKNAVKLTMLCKVRHVFICHETLSMVRRRCQPPALLIFEGKVG